MDKRILIIEDEQNIVDILAFNLQRDGYETLEAMVVYRALYGEQRLWVRPAAMWNEEVDVDGVKVRRFSLVSDEKR